MKQKGSRKQKIKYVNLSFSVISTFCWSETHHSKKCTSDFLYMRRAVVCSITYFISKKMVIESHCTHVGLHVCVHPVTIVSLN